MTSATRKVTPKPKIILVRSGESRNYDGTVRAKLTMTQHHVEYRHTKGGMQYALTVREVVEVVQYAKEHGVPDDATCKDTGFRCIRFDWMRA